MQFEDAEETSPASAALPAAPLAPSADLTAPRQVPGTFLDDDIDEEDEEDDDLWDEEDEAEWASERGLSAGINELMDQDWADASGDFTKRYNRMRQHVVATHAALPRSSPLAPSDDPTVRPGNVLPATNRPRAAAARSGPSGAGRDTGTATGVHLNKVSDQLATYSRYASQIDLEPLYPTSAQTTRKGGSEKILVKDKSDRATNEQVLDPRTRLILFKMLGRGLIERVDGCVSTGKEANVYHAVSPEARHLALKIYKTSILVFKDRDRYVSGEFRFKSGYARSNPRKMVRLWAEKEMRNLRRMRTAGLRVPEAIEVRENVLVMEFMGADEWQASPRLKDASIPADQQRRLYIEILVILRTIFTRCKLVHADFSEYNILYHEGHLWVIDVSQSVEQDHPAAFDFLRSDIQNANDFFARRGVDTLGLTRTFNYVTRASWISGRPETDEDMAIEAERLLALAEVEADDVEEEDEGREAGREAKSKPSASDEAVFAQSYIPRALDQVYDIERDVARVLKGEGSDLIYADITGVADIRKKEAKASGVRFDDGQALSAEGTSLKTNLIEGQGEKAGEADGEGEDAEESGSGSGSEEDEDSEEDYDERRPKGKKFEDKDEKKKRRQETKENAREKRSQKMSKGEKARRVKRSSGKK